VDKMQGAGAVRCDADMHGMCKGRVCRCRWAGAEGLSVCACLVADRVHCIARSWKINQ
jgi:hypothetical protein